MRAHLTSRLATLAACALLLGLALPASAGVNSVCTTSPGGTCFFACDLAFISVAGVASGHAAVRAQCGDDAVVCLSLGACAARGFQRAPVQIASCTAGNGATIATCSATP